MIKSKFVIHKKIKYPKITFSNFPVIPSSKLHSDN